MVHRFWVFGCLSVDNAVERLSCRTSRHIVLKEDYVEIHSGSFAAVTDYFKYSNIEVVRLKSTPFTPYYHRVSLFISTNGSSFVVRSLKEDEAREIYELLLCKCNAFDMFAST